LLGTILQKDDTTEGKTVQLTSSQDNAVTRSDACACKNNTSEGDDARRNFSM